MNVITKSAKKTAIYFVYFIPWVCMISAITGTLMWSLNIQDTWETAAKIVVFITPITGFIGLYIPVFAVQLFPHLEFCKMPRDIIGMMSREIVSQIPALIAWGIVLSLISPLCTAVYIVSNLTLLVIAVVSIVMLTEEEEQQTQQ
jgi:uncharacterized membrane protein